MSTKTMSNGVANKDQLLAAATGRRRFREVSLPVSGLAVRIRSLTESEVSAYYAHVATAKTDTGRNKRIENANRRMFALCLVDHEGNRLLTDAEADCLGNLDAADSQELAVACQQHAGINQRDVEDLVKNSEPTGAGDSRSDSPDAPAEST